MDTDYKLPKLPAFDVLRGSSLEGWSETYSKRLVRRIQRDSIEFGRILERQRLEPLKAAIASLDDAKRGDNFDKEIDARNNVVEAARNLLKNA